jgi:crotonobetainyl-CoA:carnitine CoA-transferase CaiB-like acyl-CoA transferase
MVKLGRTKSERVLFLWLTGHGAILPGFVDGDYLQDRELASKRRLDRTTLDTADERYLIMSMARTPEEVALLLASLALSGLRQDKILQTPETRFSNNDRFYDALQARTMMELVAHQQRQFKHHRVPASLAGRIEEMADGPQVLINEMTAPPSEPSIRGHVISHSIDEIPKNGLEKAPPLGEPNVESRSALGFSADQLKKLRPDGVI